MALIRTGLLMIPELDEAAAETVRSLLRAACPSALMIMESAAANRRNWIEAVLVRWCDEEELDLILTVGGTLPAAGPSAHEIVPEATTAVIERPLPGLSEAMRAYGQEQTLLALLDRGVAGIRGRTLLLNLPAGASAAGHFLEAVVDLIEPILQHVQADPRAPSLAAALDANASPAELDDAPEAPSPTPGGLDPDEFAAFLRRTRGDAT
jgi:molybdopterin biosynthesis enzyme MoaB